MHLFWELLREAVPMITHGDPTLFGVVWFTLQVAAIATGLAIVIGVPIGLAIGVGRSGGGRGAAACQFVANCSLGLPPALVGAVLYLLFAGHAPLAGLHLIFTRRVVFIAQTILALPYTVALTAASVQGLPPGLTRQARLLGARRRHLWWLVLREARIGVATAAIAALGSALSEVAAIAILGGNIYGYNQTLASATLFEVNGGHYAQALSIAIVLSILIVILLGGLSLLQYQSDGIRMRFRAAT
jgi:tungstate transport system permease protein